MTPDDIELVHWTALLDEPAPRWRVHGVIPDDAVTILFGDPEAGKSFLAVSFAVAVAGGVPWFERDTRQASVIYIVGEGRRGIAPRIAAASRAAGVDPRALSIRMRLVPLDLTSAVAVQEFLESMISVDPPVGLIIADTLGRCTPGGDGDHFDPALVNATFNQIERIREATMAAIVLLDHPNNADKKRPNGSFVKSASADAIWSVSWERDTDLRVLTATKLKDFARDANDVMTFKLTAQKGGSAALKLVEEQFDDPETHKAEHACLVALDAVALDRGATNSEWQAAAQDGGIKRTTFYKARKRVLRGHLVEEIGNRYRLTAGGQMLVRADEK